MRKRVSRQEEIRRIVRRERVRTQRELVDRLQALGYVCTQATVSRDISEMGLRKLPEGLYVLSEDLHLQRMISELVINIVRSENLVLIKNSAGTASGVAAALDHAELPEVLGSIAGDDTVLVIARSVHDAEQLVDHLDKFRGTNR